MDVSMYVYIGSRSYFPIWRTCPKEAVNFAMVLVALETIYKKFDLYKWMFSSFDILENSHYIT